MSPIVGPSLVSVLPMTILPMDADIVSRYTYLVESSQTILLVLILEILDVPLPMADTSVGVFPPGHVVPGVCILIVVLMKIWVGVEDRSTADMLVGGNAGMDRAPGKRVDG